MWAELAKHDSLLLNIALEELIRAAIDGGLGSRRCEQVADTLIAMSSINVRARVLMKLRKVSSSDCPLHVLLISRSPKTLFKASGKATRSLSQSPYWGEISALARLALVAGYSSRLAVQNQLFVPEIAHLTTMLCATGSLPMKTTIYGIAMNLIQSLHIARAEHDMSAMELKKLLDDAAQQDILQKFGLVRAYPSSEFTSVESPSDQIPMLALEGITELLIKVMNHGAHSTGRYSSLISFNYTLILHSPILRPFECMAWALDEPSHRNSFSILPLYPVSGICRPRFASVIKCFGCGRRSPISNVSCIQKRARICGGQRSRCSHKHVAVHC